MLNRFGMLPALLFLLTAPGAGLWGQSSFHREEQIIRRARFHENVEVRADMKETITAPFYSLLTRQKEVREQIISPVAVEFELRKSAESFYLLFKNEQKYRYPVWGRGNYIIKRSLLTGEFQQIKIFLQNDEESFIRLFPLGKDRAVMDMRLYGSPLYSGIVIPVSLEELAVSPFTRLMHLTRGTVRWEMLLADGEYPEWRGTAGLVRSIRDNLAPLSETYDGAQDSHGRFVRIEDGSPQELFGGVNCSGFAKWVCDGILLAERGGASAPLIAIDELKMPTGGAEEREANPWSAAMDEERDPYFGLDWTRNLARVWEEVRREAPVEDPTLPDVTEAPFFHYRENIGFELENLRALLYLLAIENPGAFYMGSINSLFGEDPVLWQYHHVALFFPWFNREGDFRLAVFETGVESTLENLEARYPDSFVHLVKLEGAEGFLSPSGSP